MINDQPAFPCTYYYDDKPSGHSEGMTLRDWFAGQALNGLLAMGVMAGAKSGSDAVDTLSGAAYEYADAMLKVRSETPK